MTVFNSPGPTPKAALDFLARKRLEPGFSYLDVWQEEHAHAFTVAKLMDVDLLRDVQESLVEHIQEGRPFAEFQKRIKPVMQAKGWWGEAEVVDPVTGEKHLARVGSPRRLQTIYETNMRTARAVGQWQRIERTASALPYLVYLLGPSERHRPEHAAWSGKCLPITHSFWSIAFPPNGYGCKCHTRQVSAREAERIGIDADFTFETIAVENTRTGRVVETIPGVHPSFAYNPGKTARAAMVAR